MLPYLPPSLEYYYWPKVGGAAGETKTTLNNDYKAKLQNLFIALKMCLTSFWASSFFKRLFLQGYRVWMKFRPAMFSQIPWVYY